MGSLGVGATLREERIRKQLSLEAIARQTKIPERSLKAIESDDFDALPGIIFTRNFVRQYASVVDLDPNPLLQNLPQFDLESAPMPNPPSRSKRRWDPRWNATLATVSWTLLALGAAGAAYLHFNKLPRSASVEAKSPEPPKAVAAQQPEQEPPPPAVITAAAARHAVNVVVTALSDSWVQLTADGKNAFVGTIKAGESQTVSADSLVKVLTGNAGGVQVSLNGKTLDALGPAGQIRTLRLTAEGPQSGPKTPQSSPDPI